ncbi:MAG: hypothetical protein JWO09_2298 [Bacteroidetes bacterium]|nr:hypothetical protein [Bacteroidota bacterium]
MKMRTFQLILVSLIGLIAACRPAKNTSASTAPPAGVVIPESDAYLFGKPADGLRAPGDAELAAMQAQYKELTLEKLKEGHEIYTKGACVGCHGAVDVYSFGHAQWKDIIDDMAVRASITDPQKDAVYKYVLSIKATQPK